MHLNEAFTYLSAFVLGGKFMEHYNRDNFEKSHTRRIVSSHISFTI